jgi:prepilin peptidase CpaA
MTLTCIALGIVLSLAAYTDLKYRRIPNAIVAAGLCAALATVSLGWSPLTLSQSLLGAMTGLLMFLPLYMMGAVGAGDAKLMSAVGAFLGTQAVAWVVAYTALIGGAMAVVTVLVLGNTRQTLEGIWAYLRALSIRFSGVGAPMPTCVPSTTARMPYALAIGAGAVTWLALGPLVH